ncbi:MAG: PQQ-dependent dehydrogenase, methanol/ethanol family [Acidobacteriaceae bacterium]
MSLASESSISRFVAIAVTVGGGLSALLIAGCAVQSGAANAPNSSNYDVPGTLPGIHLVSPTAKGEWTQPAGDYANTRFSQLDQINTQNVKGLHLVSTMSTGIPHGHEGQPLVVNNTMYVVTPFPNYLIALDLTKPGSPQKWKYDPHASNRAVGIACCDIVNRGAVYADGKIIYNTLDDHTVAVNAETGQEVWKTVVGNPEIAETETMAPLVAKDVVLVGVSGGELGVRGRLQGLDLKTGKILWRAWSTGSDADVRIGPDFKPFYKKDQGKDLGISTWGPDQWKLGGGTVWGWISYDPALNLIYYGTGNTGPWNEDQRPGDNKWAISIFARDPTTGDAKWAFQVVPHAGWDYDEIMEHILVDMEWNGRMRKLLISTGKTGYVLVLDRETGELLSAEPFQPVTWSHGYDLKTGSPNIDDSKQTHMGKKVTGICPSNIGAKNNQPDAFSPRTGLLYIPAHNICMDFEGTQANYIAGTPYIGAIVLNYTPRGQDQGEFVAWDIARAKKVWSIKEKQLALYSGVLATAGDVVFYGTLDGWFRAVDARNGNMLWQFKTGSGIISNPMTYLGPDGKQYVAVYSGVGGALGSIAFPSISDDDPYAALGAAYAIPQIKKTTVPGGALYVFGF